MDGFDFDKTVVSLSAGQGVFDRYTLVDLLGRGGMGVVWLAQDRKLGRELALKFLPEVLALDPRAIEDLKRETRRALDLTHPNIVRIYDFVDNAQQAAIAMEYVAGATLAKLALERPDRIFNPEELDPWVRQLCEVLTYAHTKARVVHRDLKPANLMIDNAGDLKVTDFGISATITDSATRVSKQMSSSGTPVYMSPQQMMGEKPAVADDIYSLGATLYELLTGRPPFYTGNLIAQVQGKVPAKVSERRAELDVRGAPIPPAWEETIAACLAKEQKDRPQSAAEVLERFTRVQKATVAPSRPPKPAEAPKPVKTATTSAPPPARVPIDPGSSVLLPGQKRVSSKPKRKRGALVLWLVVATVLAAGAGYYFGVYAPQQRQLELARLQKEKAEAERLRVEQAAKAEAARLAAARGGLKVQTDPAGADVAVSGIGTDRSPATFKGLRLGSYDVTVSKAGYEPQTVKLKVEEGKFTEPAAIVLRPSVGAAELTSEPTGLDYELTSAKLVAAGLPAVRRTGTTPAKLGDLPLGSYTVTYRRENWPAQTATIEVKRGETARTGGNLAGSVLSLTTEPEGADWRINRMPAGVDLKVTVGRTPYELKEVPPGDYEVTFARSGGWLPVTCRVTVGKDKSASVAAEFRSGVLNLTTEPASANFTIKGGPDGRHRSTGTTPQDVTLPVGSYEVTFNPDDRWAAVTRTFEVGANGPTDASVEFPAGTIELGSTPAGAEVWQKGKWVGVTPFTVRTVPPGTYEYELRLKGYKTTTADVTVNAKEVARTSLELNPQPDIGQRWTVPGLKLGMEWIAPGRFVMGSSGGYAAEKPAHEVTLTKGYWLGATEVTQRQWQAVMGSNPSANRDPDRPVEQVSWEDAMEFCRRLTERERAAERLPDGYAYTLPTEAQWEYACRAGTTGDYAGDVNAMGWFLGNSGQHTHTVAEKKPNAWGLYDMHGNVWEWCLDWYGDYPDGSVIDPTGPTSGTNSILRGGSSGNANVNCRSAVRGMNVPSGHDNNLGFRVAFCQVQ